MIICIVDRNYSCNDLWMKVFAGESIISRSQWAALVARNSFIVLTSRVPSILIDKSAGRTNHEELEKVSLKL